MDLLAVKESKTPLGAALARHEFRKTIEEAVRVRHVDLESDRSTGSLRRNIVPAKDDMVRRNSAEDELQPGDLWIALKDEIGCSSQRFNILWSGSFMDGGILEGSSSVLGHESFSRLGSDLPLGGGLASVEAPVLLGVNTVKEFNCADGIVQVRHIVLIALERLMKTGLVRGKALSLSLSDDGDGAGGEEVEGAGLVFSHLFILLLSFNLIDQEFD